MPKGVFKLPNARLEQIIVDAYAVGATRENAYRVAGITPSAVYDFRDREALAVAKASARGKPRTSHYVLLQENMERARARKLGTLKTELFKIVLDRKRPAELRADLILKILALLEKENWRITHDIQVSQQNVIHIDETAYNNLLDRVGDYERQRQIQDKKEVIDVQPVKGGRRKNSKHRAPRRTKAGK